VVDGGFYYDISFENAEPLSSDEFDAIEVEDLKRREYSCSCCSLRISLDALTTILGSSDLLVQCGSCDRILFLEASTRETINAKK